MKVYKPLEKNIGRFFHTTSWTHHGIIIGINEKMENIIYVDFIDEVPKVSTFGLYSRRTHEWVPAETNMKYMMKQVFDPRWEGIK